MRALLGLVYVLLQSHRVIATISKILLVHLAPVVFVHLSAVEHDLYEAAFVFLHASAHVDGIARKACNKVNIEIDHLVPLEDCGTNDISNLWAQPRLPRPAALDKDILENKIKREVCADEWTFRRHSIG